MLSGIADAVRIQKSQSVLNVIWLFHRYDGTGRVTGENIGVHDVPDTWVDVVRHRPTGASLVDGD